jgi:pimeloyl-ACP methyl ester carboxylesterase
VTTETIPANGLVIGYDEHGSGPPLVMLHGATSVGREDFAAQVPLFAKAFRLLLPDARGHGTTRSDADMPSRPGLCGLSPRHAPGFRWWATLKR